MPLIVAIHGLGDVPESLLALVSSCGLPARILAPRGPQVWGEGASWFDIALEPAQPRADPRGIEASADRIAALIDGAQARSQVVGEPIVTGFSQGGYLAWALAVRHPDRVGAAVPVAGALPEDLPIGAAPPRAPPIRALHGDMDPVVPSQLDLQTASRVRALGWDASVELHQGVEHAIPPGVHAALCAQLAAALPHDTR